MSTTPKREESFSSSSSDMGAHRSAGANLRNFGLHQLRAPKSDLVILFVHGILSGGETAWGQPSWPELVANESDFQDAGIFLFTYQSTVSSRTYSIGDVVDALREHFNLEALWNRRRLVFVCHSMGGIVVRRFIVANQAKLIEHNCSIGLFLVASPSLGSSDANLIGLLALVLQHTQALALRLSQTNTWLNDLDREFMTLKESNRLWITGKELVEDRAIVLKRWFGLRKQVVEPFSSGRYFGEVFKVPGSDHISISKPQSPDAIQHRLLKRFITEFNPAEAELTLGIEAIQENLDEFEEIRPILKQLVGWPGEQKPPAVTHHIADSGNAVEFVGYGEVRKVTKNDLARLSPEDRRAIAASKAAMRRLVRDWNVIVEKGQLSEADQKQLLGIASQMRDRLELIFEVVEISMGGILQDHFAGQRAIARHASERYGQLQSPIMAESGRAPTKDSKEPTTGDRSIALGRDAIESVIITGDNNRTTVNARRS
jgi:hypothetical protein